MPSGDIPVDRRGARHRGPARRVRAQPGHARRPGVRRRAAAAGIPVGDYNGRDRGGPAGVVSLLQTTTKRRQAVQHLPRLPRGRGGDAAEPDGRHAAPRRPGCVLEGEPGTLRATGVEYVSADGDTAVLEAGSEVILSAGAVGSPQLLHAVGHRPARRTSESLGVDCLRRRARGGPAPQGPPAAGPDVPGTRARRLDGEHRRVAMGPDALRAPAGPLPADPADDATLPPELAGAQGRGRAPARRVVRRPATGWCRRRFTTRAPGCRPGSATSTPTTRRSAIFACGYNADIWNACLRVDATEYFADPASTCRRRPRT